MIFHKAEKSMKKKQVHMTKTVTDFSKTLSQMGDFILTGVA